MSTVSIFEAKAELDRLVDLAERGQDTIIVRAGVPVAKITQAAQVKKPIRYGALKDKIRISEDFDAALPVDFLITRGA